MIAAIRLGVRLAGAGAAASAARRRSVLVALAAAVGTVLLLAALAIAHSETAAATDVTGPAGPHATRNLVVAVIVVVSMAVLVLAATAGRLAAALRDQRLANLRLLGMTAAQTRVVAAVETGLAAAAGAVVGLAVFFPVRAALGWWHPAGRPWSYASLTPTLAGYVLVILGVPLAVTIVSASSRGGRARQVVAQSRRADTRRPGWWRLVLMLAGMGCAIYVVAVGDSANMVTLVPWALAAVVLLGLGVVLVIPSLVRLIADLLVRRRDRPVLVIAGRRLQAQPAAASRLVAGLLIALFVVTGTRMVVVSYEQTQGYQAAAAIDTTGQAALVPFVSPDDAGLLGEALRHTPGVRAVAAFPRLAQVCTAGARCSSLGAVVASCAELATLFGPLPDCRDDEPAWVGSRLPVRAPDSLTYRAMTGDGVDADPSAADAVTVPGPAYRLDSAAEAGLFSQFEVVLPPSLPGVAAVGAMSPAFAVVVAAEPGLEIEPVVNRVVAEAGADLLFPDMRPYWFAAGLRALVWAITAVVLALGLIAFGIGAVDRVIARRAEIISLQLVGTGGKVLRRTQWIESSLPLVSGIVLSIAAGSLAGTAFLTVSSSARISLPWSEFAVLAAIAVAAAVVMAGMTVIAASPRIRPELIRTE